MEKYFSALRACALFSGIADDDLTAILACIGARTVKYARGEVIFAHGDAAVAIGLVLSGSVQLERTEFAGNRLILGSVAESELFGEVFACAEVSLPLDAVAAETSVVMLIDCQRLMCSCGNACEFHRRLIFNLMKILADKNLTFHRKLEILSKRTTREKLLAYLYAEAAQNGSNRFTIPYDRQMLADYLGVDRSGLSAELSKLVREGVLTTRKNEFVLSADPD